MDTRQRRPCLHALERGRVLDPVIENIPLSQRYFLLRLKRPPGFVEPLAGQFVHVAVTAADDDGASSCVARSASTIARATRSISSSWKWDRGRTCCAAFARARTSPLRAARAAVSGAPGQTHSRHRRGRGTYALTSTDFVRRVASRRITACSTARARRKISSWTTCRSSARAFPFDRRRQPRLQGQRGATGRARAGERRRRRHLLVRPTVMMRAAQKLAETHGIPHWASLEIAWAARWVRAARASCRRNSKAPRRTAPCATTAPCSTPACSSGTSSRCRTTRDSASRLGEK